MLLDVGDMGLAPDEASRILLDECGVAATAMTGWGDAVASRYVRFVFSNEPVERLRTLADRLGGTALDIR